MTVFSAKEIIKSFEDKIVLKGINLTLKNREHLGIVGPSNSGKSTFLKILAGIYHQTSGELIYTSDYKPSVGFLFQEGGLFDGLTVIENVMFPLVSGVDTRKRESKKLSREEATDLSAEILKKVGLAKALYKLPSELSGGMRKRVGIARALVASPELLLLDDPTSGLDPVTATSIMELISELEGDSDCSSIIVSHDIRRLVPKVQRVVMFDSGKVVGDCMTSDLQANANTVMIEFLKTRFSFNNECKTS